MKAINKRSVAGFLAASMVLTMLPPALPVYAEHGLPVGNNVPSEIILDSGYGPRPTWGYRIPENLVPAVQKPVMSGTTDILKGATGTTLKTNYPALTTDPTDYSGYGANSRPLLPEITTSWYGYEFAGWYEEPGGVGKVLKLPHAFADYDWIKYYAHWTGKSTEKSNYQVVHERLLPGGGGTPVVFLEEDTLLEAAQTISAKPKRSGIPGYTYQHTIINGQPENSSAQVTPQYFQKWTALGSPTEYTSNEIGSFSPTSYAFSGSMPNEATKVTYRYVPNPNKKFNVRIEYVDAGNAPIKNPDMDKFSAEQSLGNFIKPATISGYAYTPGNYTVVTGDTDNLASGEYGFITAGCTWSGDQLSGWMPNQNVTIRYQYALNSSYQVDIDVVYKDSSGTNLRTVSGLIDPSLYPPSVGWNPNPSDLSVLIDVPSSVTGYEPVFYPTATLNGTTLTAQRIVSGGNVKVKVSGFPGIPSLTDQIELTLTYSQLAANWATVYIECGPNGSLGGHTTRTYLKGQTYTLNDLVGHISVTPDANYIKAGTNGDGWYQVGAGNSLTEVTGDILLTGDLTLRASFVKDPSKWHTVKFTAGNHGSISNVGVQTVVTGTLLGGLAIPTPTPTNTAYTFAGWFDQNGNAVTMSDSITGDMVYTARFRMNTPDLDYDDLNRPNAHGQVGSNATGEIVILDRVDDRTYAIVDRTGQIVAIVTGSAASNTQSGLEVSTYYEVYELDSVLTATASSFVGTAIGAVSLKSNPTLVRVPAVNEDHVTIVTDPVISGKVQLEVSQTAPNTVYAILDEEGNVVSVTGSDSTGWVTPDASGTIAFDGLEPNTNYTVVAKEMGNGDTPIDRKDYGSNLFTDSSSATGNQHLVQTINGTVTRVDGQTVSTDEYPGIGVGKPVRVYSNIPGQTFKQWRVLIGDIGVTPAPDQQTVNFLMPDHNVVMVAVYDAPSLGTASNATVDFKVVGRKQGEVALNVSADLIEVLRERLTTAADEAILATSGREVSYLIQFKQRTPLATESEAVREETGIAEEAFRAAWSLDTSLHRYVDGTARPLDPGADAGTFEVLLQMNQKDLGYEEYELWKLETDPTGAVSASLVPMTPDPNVLPGNGGLFRFDAEVGAVYVLGYAKTCRVKITNARTNFVDQFKVYQGTLLEDNSSYDDWLNLQMRPVVIDLDGKPWNYKGLSKDKNSWKPYNSTAIKGDLTLYAYYEADQAWLDAKNELEALIKKAEQLLPGLETQTDQDTLQQAIDTAKNVLSQGNQRPTLQDLLDAKGDLESIIKDLTGIDPGKPINPPKPSKPGSGSGGGGGGGFSGTPKTTTTTGGYKTYSVGKDGNWELVDAQKQQWVFQLTGGARINGTWAYVKYEYQGSAQTYRYHFNAEGIMDSGWFKDTDGKWYYLSTDHDGWFGRMITGWHLNPVDQKWYYLDPSGGQMVTGWREIDQSWFYFTASNQRDTWNYNEATKQWEFLGNQERPFGSMFAAEATPDGYQVNANGAWNR